MIIPISPETKRIYVNTGDGPQEVKQIVYNDQQVSNVVIWANYYEQYFTIETLEANCTVTFTMPATITTSMMTSMSYSTDSGRTWTTTQNTNSSVDITVTLSNAGDKVLWKGIGTAVSSRTSSSRFKCDKQYIVYGNINSLVLGDLFIGNDTCFVFKSLFSADLDAYKTLTSAKNLILPATTLVDYCYSSLFGGQTYLTEGPTLAATELAKECYAYMYSYCDNLNVIPELPALVMKEGCYSGMFQHVYGYRSIPILPATTLAPYCYSWMFDSSTFWVPEGYVLPAETLAEGCYSRMFSNMAYNHTSPILPATVLAQDCYYGMFRESSVKKITCFATDVSDSTYFRYWVESVPNNGTFYKTQELTSWVTASDRNLYIGIPSGWTVQDYAA